MIQSRIIRLTIASIGSPPIIAKIYLQRRMLKSYEMEIMRLHERRKGEGKKGWQVCMHRSRGQASLFPPLERKEMLIDPLRDSLVERRRDAVDAGVEVVG